MSDKVESAAERFKKGGHNCAQAVFCAFSAELGLDEETAYRLSSPLGAGMGRKGEVCGALSGALLALGLARGQGKGEGREGKERIYGLTRDLIECFAKQNGAVRCRDLLQLDLGTPEGFAEAAKRNCHDTRCACLVRSAAELAEHALAGKGCPEKAGA